MRLDTTHYDRRLTIIESKIDDLHGDFYETTVDKVHQKLDELEAKLDEITEFCESLRKAMQ